MIRKTPVEENVRFKSFLIPVGNTRCENIPIVYVATRNGFVKRGTVDEIPYTIKIDPIRTNRVFSYYEKNCTSVFIVSNGELIINTISHDGNLSHWKMEMPGIFLGYYNEKLVFHKPSQEVNSQMSMKQLKDIAREKRIPGFSTYKKQDKEKLIELIKFAGIDAEFLFYDIRRSESGSMDIKLVHSFKKKMDSINNVTELFSDIRDRKFVYATMKNEVIIGSFYPIKTIVQDKTIEGRLIEIYEQDGDLYYTICSIGALTHYKNHVAISVDRTDIKIFEKAWKIDENTIVATSSIYSKEDNIYVLSHRDIYDTIFAFGNVLLSDSTATSFVRVLEDFKMKENSVPNYPYNLDISKMIEDFGKQQFIPLNGLNFFRNCYTIYPILGISRIYKHLVFDPAPRQYSSISPLEQPIQEYREYLRDKVPFFVYRKDFRITSNFIMSIATQISDNVFNALTFDIDLKAKEGQVMHNFVQGNLNVDYIFVHNSHKDTIYKDFFYLRSFDYDILETTNYERPCFRKGVVLYTTMEDLKEYLTQKLLTGNSYYFFEPPYNLSTTPFKPKQ